jgi:hypothetical protein
MRLPWKVWPLTSRVGYAASSDGTEWPAIRAQSGPHSEGEKTAMTKIQIDQHGSSDEQPTIGALLAPLFTWRGRDFYPVFGAEGDGDGDDDGSGEGDDDTGDGTGNKADDDGSATVSQAEYDKLLARLKASDKNNSAVQKKLKEIEDGKKDELTKATERVAELEKAQEASAKEISEMRLQNAFLTANTDITWHDPGDALALAERKGYLEGVVDEDGKVDSKKLEAKLKELAKASPHLVKSGKSDDSSGGKGTPVVATGSNVGGKGKKTDKGPDLSRYNHILNR